MNNSIRLDLKITISTILFFLPFILLAQDADVLKSDAIMNEGQMQYLKAAELYEKAALAYESENQSDVFLWFKSGQNYNRVKQYDKALPVLLKAKDGHYKESELFLSLADSYIGLKKFKEAEIILMEGKDLENSEDVDFSKRLGLVYLNTKQYDKSINLLNTSLKADPQNYRLWYLLASTYERQKELANACDCYKRMLEIKPEDKTSIKKLGVLNFQQTDYKYKKETKRYESLKNPTRVDYHNSTKKLETISQDYKIALPYLEKAHANSPNDKAVISCLGIAYRRLKMEVKADEFSKLMQ